MPIVGWIVWVLLAIVFIFLGACLFFESGNTLTQVVAVILAIALIVGSLFGFLWYFKNTADGQRMMIDQKSNFQNGIERTITVYTANGEVIATYSGKIDIEGNDGGYVLFDFDGKRYIYYNCFVESIADIS